MLKTTPFHARTAVLNQTMLWDHWAGYAAATKYQFSEKVEYYTIRNAVALFDTSPLFKYRFQGPDAERFLIGVLARDIRQCSTGRAQYTLWCDDRGFVVEDGVILHVRDDEYWLTAAVPNLRYFQDLAGGFDVDISDISDEYGILSLQGPHARNVLQSLTKAVADLRFFGVTETKIGRKPVVISRTGYTGDLGYEIWIQPDDCLALWDTLMEAGAGYNITPMGLRALSMSRIEAGLLLIDVDFESARYAWIDGQKATPLELSFDWMFRKLKEDDRAFIGRRLLEQEMQNGTSRFKVVGLEVDWRAFESAHNDIGLIARKDHTPIEEAMYLYDAAGKYTGYITSFMYSPILKKHIALGKVPLAQSKPGSEVQLEWMVNHKPHYLLSRVVSLPFFNPARKTALA
jgi:aminomethyltransferase